MSQTCADYLVHRLLQWGVHRIYGYPGDGIKQRVLAGDPKFCGSQALPEFAYAAYAEMLGLKGIRLDRPERVGATWDEALVADRPVVIDAHTDPEVPPLPPHITLKQARHYVAAVLRGEPNWRDMIRHSFQEMIESWKAHSN